MPPLDSAAADEYNKERKREGRRTALKKKKKKSKVGYQVAAGVMDVFGAAAASLLTGLSAALFSAVRAAKSAISDAMREA